ncbi:MAG: adenylyltransferase/cytidyltransferase family protein, partial [Lachnoclostridium sp.]|nr:adenylyltransferase/cytidyltransferase family protein [Lachnoclostridium sp.]
MIQGSVICIGKFNGFHIGHQSLIRYAVKEAERKGYIPVMITFTSDASSSFERNEIYDSEEKKQLAGELGIEHYKEYDFTEDFKKMSPEKFAEDILCKEYNAKMVVVGEDFRFGYKQSGNVELLDKLSKEFGFECVYLNKVKFDNKTVSSSNIRELISTGDIEMANLLLGRAFSYDGIVDKGNRVGRTLDMPTANLIPKKNKVLPPNGVYASHVIYNGTIYRSITNIGVRPTVSDEVK